MATTTNPILKKEQDRAKANGDSLNTGESFSGAVRNVDLSLLEEGDKWTMPTKYEVNKGRFGEYIFIEVTNKAGLKKVVSFFPSTFTKVRSVCEKDEKGNVKLTGTTVRVKTEGTATELFRSFADVNSGMQALAGKKLKVSKVNTIFTPSYSEPGRAANAQMLTIDLDE